MLNKTTASNCDFGNSPPFIVESQHIKLRSVYPRAFLTSLLRYSGSRVLCLIVVLITVAMLLQVSLYVVYSPQRTTWASLSVKPQKGTNEHSYPQGNNIISTQKSWNQLLSAVKAGKHEMRNSKMKLRVEGTDGNEGLGNAGIILLAILVELIVVGLSGALAYTMGSVGLAVAIGIVATAGIVFLTMKWIKRRNRKKSEKIKKEDEPKQAE